MACWAHTFLIETQNDPRNNNICVTRATQWVVANETNCAPHTEPYALAVFGCAAIFISPQILRFNREGKGGSSSNVLAIRRSTTLIAHKSIINIMASELLAKRINISLDASIN